MHLLLILILLMIAFPMFRRLVGSLLSAIFWIFVAAAAVAEGIVG
ncbi:MAG: hypothetical protein ABSC06_37265 [Rhodopila sp.]|jgi:predicted ABC-type exoprotein transport system permease subunit